MTMRKLDPNVGRTLVLALGVVLVATAPSVVSIAAAAPPPACQAPLFVQQAAVPGNVMLVVDDSGSMGAVVHHSGYDSTVDWPGDQLGWFNVGADGDITLNAVTIFLAAGWYQDNYINWMFWNTTPAERAAMPTSTRMDVVHDVFSDFVANAPANINIGLASLNTAGGIIHPCGTDRATIITSINNLVASGGTPLARASEDAASPKRSISAMSSPSE